MTERVSAKTLLHTFGLELAQASRARAAFSRDLGRRIAGAILQRVKDGHQSAALQSEVSQLIAEAKANGLSDVEATTAAAALMMARLAKDIVGLADYEADSHERTAETLDQLRSLPPS